MKKKFNFFETFDNIKLPNNECIEVKQVIQNVFVGKDKNNFAYLLIKTQNEQKGWNLKHLEIKHNRECNLKLGSKTIKDYFSSIECKTSDVENQKLFWKFIELIEFDGDFDEIKINNIVQIALEFFQVLQKPPKKTIQGLYTEVLVIAMSKNPDVFLQAWHSDSLEPFDFKWGKTKLEVKSTSQRQRQHLFSLNQLKKQKDEQVIFVSALVEENSSGTSINDLRTKILENLKDKSLINKLDQVILESLGKNWEQCDKKFSPLAEKNLKFFNKSQVPLVDFPEEWGANTKIEIDLSTIKEMQKQEKKTNELLKYF